MRRGVRGGLGEIQKTADGWVTQYLRSLLLKSQVIRGRGGGDPPQSSEPVDAEQHYLGMVKNSGAVFRPVQFELGKIHVAGGYLPKAMAMITKTVDHTDCKKKIFVKMGSTENWLLASTCGSTRRHSTSFGRTSLLEILRERILQLCDGIDAIAGAPIASAVEYDPMAEIGGGDDALRGAGLTTSTADARGRTRYC